MSSDVLTSSRYYGLNGINPWAYVGKRSDDGYRRRVDLSSDPSTVGDQGTTRSFLPFSLRRRGEWPSVVQSCKLSDGLGQAALLAWRDIPERGVSTRSSCLLAGRFYTSRSTRHADVEIMVLALES